MISVIVPVYNASEYLEECVTSILNQTYQNFELILIDDGSKDNSLEILKKFELTDKRVKIYEHSNHGVSYTRNRGIELAQGKYILFVDSDDWLENDTLEKLSQSIKKYDVDVVRCNYYVNKEQEQIVGNDYFRNSVEVYNRNQIHDEIVPVLLDDKMKSFSVLYLLKADIIKKKLYFNEEIHMLEDQLFCLSVLNNIDKIAFIDVPLYHYRVNPTSVTVKIDCIKQNIEDVIKVNKMVTGFLKENGYNEENIKILNKSHMNFVIRSFEKLYKANLLEISYLKNIRNLPAMDNLFEKYSYKYEKNKKIMLATFLFKHKFNYLLMFMLKFKRMLNKVVR